MNSIFKPLIDRGVVAVYMDDILVFTETNEQHTAVVREVLKILRDNNLISQTGEMCLSPTRSRIFRSNHRQQASPHGPNQSIRYRDLACTHKETRIATIPRLLQFLPPLHQRLLENR